MTEMTKRIRPAYSRDEFNLTCLDRHQLWRKAEGCIYLFFSLNIGGVFGGGLNVLHPPKEVSVLSTSSTFHLVLVLTLHHLSQCFSILLGQCLIPILFLSSDHGVVPYVADSFALGFFYKFFIYDPIRIFLEGSEEKHMPHS